MRGRTSYLGKETCDPEEVDGSFKVSNEEQ